jgi:hypothetical protein
MSSAYRVVLRECPDYFLGFFNNPLFCICQKRFRCHDDILRQLMFGALRRIDRHQLTGPRSLQSIKQKGWNPYTTCYPIAGNLSSGWSFVGFRKRIYDASLNSCDQDEDAGQSGVPIRWLYGA